MGGFSSSAAITTRDWPVVTRVFSRIPAHLRSAVQWASMSGRQPQPWGTTRSSTSQQATNVALAFLRALLMASSYAAA